MVFFGPVRLQDPNLSNVSIATSTVLLGNEQRHAVFCSLRSQPKVVFQEAGTGRYRYKNEL
jgi:hypothetical protein